MSQASSTSTVGTDAPHPAGRQSTVAALVVVLVITALAAIVLLTATFSTSNTPASVDGTAATTSQFVENP